MSGTVEEQAEVIQEYLITETEKLRASIDVKNDDDASWNSARLALRLISDDDIVEELSKSAVYRAVALLYNKSDATIKRRLKAAQVFHPGIVEAHPKISFSYWRTAAAANHKDDPFESALDIIWQIESHLEAYGKLPSVRTVESWVYRDGNEPIKTVWKSRADGITDQLEKLFHDRYSPPELRSLAGYIRVLLSYYLETGKSPLTDDQFKPPLTLMESDKKGGKIQAEIN